MSKPHKHAELIKAWADGAKIEVFYSEDEWEEIANPTWNPDAKYRIKPEPKPDITQCRRIGIDRDNYMFFSCTDSANVRFTFDGETRKLKKAEVLE